MKNVLFILAHMDDESFSAGTIKKMVDKGIIVTTLIVCGNGYVLSDDRRAIIEKNLKLLGVVGFTLQYFDLSLSDLKQDVYGEIKESIQKLIMSTRADTVFTNNSGDLHPDHKIISNLVRTVCRPSSTTVKSLYECYIPGSTEYGEGINAFTTVVDVSEYLSVKMKCLENYGTSLKAATSVDSALNASSYFGSMNGYKYAEIFKPIFTELL
jgi:LmbE family N-acetylglucosaminyl deacetylase